MNGVAEQPLLFGDDVGRRAEPAPPRIRRPASPPGRRATPKPITDGVRSHAVGLDEAGLRGLALCYTCSERGNVSGIRFALSIGDAMAWCESPVSTGVLMGTRWSYFWTSAWNYLGRYNAIGDALDLGGCADNGEWDERIASLGLRKIGLHELPALLATMGVTVVANKKAAVVVLKEAA